MKRMHCITIYYIPLRTYHLPALVLAGGGSAVMHFVEHSLADKRQSANING